MFRRSLLGIGMLFPLLAMAQLPETAEEGCFYFAKVVRMRGYRDSLVQEYHFTPLLFSKACVTREEIIRSIRKAFFYQNNDPNVRDNHIFLSGPLREEEEAEDLYWEALKSIPPGSRRHLMPMKLD
ncbi:MAG: hypothetical protein KF690_10840 [Bacteroidetes bacterium]|nr:hypothetical protein [Bacteroidota bacterium]